MYSFYWATLYYIIIVSNINSITSKFLTTLTSTKLHQVTTFHSSYKIETSTKRSAANPHHHMNVSMTDQTAGTHSNNHVYMHVEQK